MATEIIMPKAGMSMEMGTVVKWLKKEGDSIEKGEPILEISTDKVNMEVESEVEGVLLKITADEGDELPVFTVIGYIGELGEVIQDAVSKTEKANKEDKSASKPLADSKSDSEYDVIIVGGGPAGYIAATKVAQLGGKVALIERDIVGGTCLNRGCIPTKTLLKSAELIEHISHAKQRGILISNPDVKVDMPTVIKEKNKVVKMLTGGISMIHKSYGVDTINGTGVLKSSTSVIVDNAKIVTGKKIILAGGSKVSRINIPGIDSEGVLDSTQILDIQEVPSRLAIIGGGVIGVEMASIFNAFGSEVTIIETMDRIVPMMDKDISAELTNQLKKKGIKIMTALAVESIEPSSEALTIHINDGSKIVVDKVLLSIGRVPDLSCLGDLKPVMEKNKVKVNDKMETSIPGVYAAGDINGLNTLAHAAYKMGEVAGANAFGENHTVNLKFVPSCIYTSPEVGSVGLTQEEAAKKEAISIGSFDFGVNGRALSSGEGVGFVKVIVSKKYGEILGVHIIGPNAAELINEAAMLMATEITVNEAATLIHAHPTYSEALMEALNDALGNCLHMIKK
ncbi:dihydrolipoyl dehydrogenase [Fusibacter ferrireducens]|uniref:Dihydrolipoyl dehydrogenase n=1 Tax=Fusibacter ferrireducens TaxID=2785058 RepID=A0ABR9ZWH2_9FIRM|nr:dihydrolipoyl dehydrogenase [Fusibacter ferrireducens]MBF4694321.1 dihydrolipoyl dehydrogenase [Fusibacter ferrireducens]